MKKMNKKGFTIVELVIVIAVIAILAAVLIPTFSGIVTKAQNSAALQEARNVYTEIYADDISDGTVDGTYVAANVTIPGTVGSYTSSVFNYTAKNGIKVSFNGTEWTVPASF